MWSRTDHCVFEPENPGGKNWSSRNADPAARVLESLLGVHAPPGDEFGSHSAILNQWAMSSSKLATLVPVWLGAGSVAGSLNFHCTLLPDAPALEKNFAVGSACPI